MNKFMILLIWLATVVVLLFGCNQTFEGSTGTNAMQSGALAEEVILHKGKFKSLAEYITWVNDTAHGFIKKQSIGGMNYEIQYKPALIRALERFSSGYQINNSIITPIITDTAKQKLVYYNIKITNDGREISTQTFNTTKSLTEYFGYYAEKDFMLINEADTLYPILYHFENTYPQFPYLSVLLAFELPEQYSNNTYQTIAFTGDTRGILQVTFNKQQIFNQPEFDKINEIWQ
jgi:hypothetical protein